MPACAGSQAACATLVSFLRPTSAAAAAPNSRTIGGAGTGAGGPPLDPVLPDPLELPDDEPLELPEEEPLELPDDDPLELPEPLDPFDDQPPFEDQPPDDEKPPLDEP